MLSESYHDLSDLVDWYVCMLLMFGRHYSIQWDGGHVNPDSYFSNLGCA